MGRDLIRGAVELRGNGQLVKRALEGAVVNLLARVGLLDPFQCILG